MSDNKSEVSLEDIVSLCKRRGFIFQGSEIYGGLAGTWDYGPLGVTLKKNLTDLWWKTFVEDRDDMVGVDAAILMNPKTWKASGHVDTFTDPVAECGTGGCGFRYRADHLIENDSELQDYISLAKRIKEDFFKFGQINAKPPIFMTQLLHDYFTDDNERLNLRKFASNYKELNFERGESTVELYLSSLLERVYNHATRHTTNLDDEVMSSWYTAINANSFHDLGLQLYLNHSVKCKNCGAKYWGTPRPFNLMFETVVGPVANDDAKVFLRPETAQGIFTNFKNVVDTLYPDVPFGIAQQGKAFRNEISPRDFVFRSREFNQMEIEYFIHESQWEELFDKWRVDIMAFLKEAGVDTEKIKEAEVAPDDLAHYSKRTIDYEFKYPHGHDELLGLAYRTNFDLGNIQRESGKKMDYRPKDGSPAFVPHVIEPSFGVERLIMAVLTSAYTEDVQNDEKRIFLKFPAHIAPIKFCVSPLLKNKPELVAKAREVYSQLKKQYGAVMWDDNGNIGKRYRRQDEIGTPYCVVIDFDTLEDGTVTVRDRDTTKQTRVRIEDLSL